MTTNIVRWMVRGGALLVLLAILAGVFGGDEMRSGWGEDGVIVAIAIGVFGMTVIPTVALTIAAVRRPAVVDPNVMQLGRVSAVGFFVLAYGLIDDAARDASSGQLAGGLVLAAVTSWIFVASWRMPFAGARPRFPWLDSLLVSFGTLAVLLVAAALLFSIGGRKMEHAYRTGKRADLRHMAAIQDSLRTALGRYGTMPEARAAGFRESSNIRVLLLTKPDGWRAISWDNRSDEDCVIWVGKRPDSGRYVGEEGEPSCTTR
jgi:hypothetical protein